MQTAMRTKTAIVIGSSGAIGGAFCSLLEANPTLDHVIGLSRSGNADRFIDITDEGSIAEAAHRAKELAKNNDSEISMIIVATGLLHSGDNQPEKSIQQLDPDWMIENFRVNTLGPALVAKHFLPLMPNKGRSVFAVLSARVGSISDNQLGGWHSYRASKAALNMIVRNLAIERNRRAPENIIVGLQPGTVESELSKPFGQARTKMTAAESATQMLNVLNSLTPSNSGQLFAYDHNLIAP